MAVAQAYRAASRAGARTGFEQWLERLARHLPESPVPPLKRRPTDPIDYKTEQAFEQAHRTLGMEGLEGAVDFGQTPLTADTLRSLRSTPGMRRQEEILQNIPKYQLGGAAVGGYLGAQHTGAKDEGDRWKRGILGAIAGGAVLPGALQAVALGRTGADKLSNYLFYAYLSSPDTIARAQLGGIGGAITHAFEQALVGMMPGAGARIAQRNAIETLKAIPEAANIYKRTLMGSETEVRQIRQSIFGARGGSGRFDVGPDPQQRFRDVGLGRWFSAGDNASVYAMTRGGMGVDEAMRYTLAGMPETWLGGKTVEITRGLLQSPNLGTRFVGATLAPFARVGAVGVEQGLKRIPWIGARAWAGGSPQLKAARQLMGAGAGTAGYFAEGDPASALGVDPRITQTAGTITGPGFLPFQLGRELRRAGQTEEGALPQAQTALGQTFLEFNPLGFQPLGIFQRPLEESIRRFAPAGLGDVAEAMDPAFGRERARADLESPVARGELPGFMAQIPGAGGLMAALPGIREQLPEQFAPVDWQGQPQLPPSALPLPEIATENIPGAAGFEDIVNRTLFPSRARTMPPASNLEDPLVRELASVGVKPSPPSGTLSIHPLLGDLKQSATSTARTQRLRGMGNTLAAQVLRQYLPLLQKLPPDQAQRWARWLYSQFKAPLSPVIRAANLQNAIASGARLQGELRD